MNIKQAIQESISRNKIADCYVKSFDEVYTADGYDDSVIYVTWCDAWGLTDGKEWRIHAYLEASE